VPTKRKIAMELQRQARLSKLALGLATAGGSKPYYDEYKLLTEDSEKELVKWCFFQTLRAWGMVDYLMKERWDRLIASI
jgi:hypothetical protein